MSLRNKIKSTIKKSPAVAIIACSLTMLGLTSIVANSASALEYQSDPINLDFNFGSTINITAGSTIEIPNLTPGTAALSSNSYTVAVTTNSLAGYTLTATVGCSTGTNCNNTKSLTNGTNSFSMVSSTSGVALDNGQWGYTIANPASATASVFKTLALYSETTPTTINKTKDANGTAYDSSYLGGNSTVFQIGAKATNSQEAGTYTNVINFLAVANPIPTYTVTLATVNADSIEIDGISYINGDTPNLVQGTHTISGTLPTGYGFGGWASTGNITIANSSSLSTTITVTGTGTLRLTGEVPKTYMQNLTSSTIATLLPSVGSTATVYDNRDENEYTIAKLADNKYWMVSNLNLAGGTAISCTTSDCENYTIPTTQGWQSGGKLPASSTSGFNTDNYAYVYNSGNITTSQSDCTSSKACNSYYSWDAATLGSGRSISTDNTNAPYSICPKGWKLPTTYNGSGTAAEATDFRKLMIALGGSNSVQTYDSSTSPTGATMYGKLTASPYNFLLAGSYRTGSFISGGSGGYYWSATSFSSSAGARYLTFSSTSVDSAYYYGRRGGFSVRCVFGS